MKSSASELSLSYFNLQLKGKKNDKVRRVTAHALIRMSEVLGIYVSLQWHEELQDDTTTVLVRKVTVKMIPLFRIFVDLIPRKARVIQKETNSSSLDYLLQHRSRTKSDLGAEVVLSLS